MKWNGIVEKMKNGNGMGEIGFPNKRLISILFECGLTWGWLLGFALRFEFTIRLLEELKIFIFFPFTSYVSRFGPLRHRKHVVLCPFY